VWRSSPRGRSGATVVRHAPSHTHFISWTLRQLMVCLPSTTARSSWKRTGAPWQSFARDGFPTPRRSSLTWTPLTLSSCRKSWRTCIHPVAIGCHLLYFTHTYPLPISVIIIYVWRFAISRRRLHNHQPPDTASYVRLSAMDMSSYVKLRRCAQRPSVTLNAGTGWSRIPTARHPGSPRGALRRSRYRGRPP